MRYGTSLRRWGPSLVLGVALTSASVSAHHSIAGMYDSSKPMTVEGTIAQFRFVSPHPFIELEEARSGRVWQIELDNRHEFEAIGITADSFKAGDRVVVVGSPGRREANRMYGRRLHRPADGFGFEESGSRPRISGRAR
jgi:Family of unknown function (DUF6152)